MSIYYNNEQKQYLTCLSSCPIFHTFNLRKLKRQRSKQQ
nr:MAG TPA: hypothetical protein [Caudoviricetes sp.]